MSAIWPQGTPSAFYMVVAWVIDADPSFTQGAHVEADITEVLEGRDFVVVATNVALVAVRYEGEHIEVYSILTHLATKKWSARLGFVMSPPLAGPAIWSGFMEIDWNAVNRITGVAEALPPPPTSQ